jgi:hypothetical protein
MNIISYNILNPQSSGASMLDATSLTRANEVSNSTIENSTRAKNILANFPGATNRLPRRPGWLHTIEKNTGKAKDGFARRMDAQSHTYARIVWPTIIEPSMPSVQNSNVTIPDARSPTLENRPSKDTLNQVTLKDSIAHFLCAASPTRGASI